MGCISCGLIHANVHLWQGIMPTQDTYKDLIKKPVRELDIGFLQNLRPSEREYTAAKNHILAILRDADGYRAYIYGKPINIGRYASHRSNEKNKKLQLLYALACAHKGLGRAAPEGWVRFDRLEVRGGMSRHYRSKARIDINKKIKEFTSRLGKTIEELIEDGKGDQRGFWRLTIPPNQVYVG